MVRPEPRTPSSTPLGDVSRPIDHLEQGGATWARPRIVRWLRMAGFRSACVTALSISISARSWASRNGWVSLSEVDSARAGRTAGPAAGEGFRVGGACFGGKPGQAVGECLFVLLDQFRHLGHGACGLDDGVVEHASPVYRIRAGRGFAEQGEQALPRIDVVAGRCATAGTGVRPGSVPNRRRRWRPCWGSAGTGCGWTRGRRPRAGRRRWRGCRLGRTVPPRRAGCGPVRRAHPAGPVRCWSPPKYSGHFTSGGWPAMVKYSDRFT